MQLHNTHPVISENALIASATSLERIDPSPNSGVYFETLACLNAIGTRFALALQLDESLQVFDQALSLLSTHCVATPNGQLVGSSLSVGMLGNNKYTIRQPLSEDYLFEYDEGWNVFACFVSFDSLNPTTTTVEHMSAVTLFNVGQVLLIERRTDVAYEFFRVAFRFADATVSHDMGTLKVAMLHRLGYIQYLHREFVDAIQTFQQALNLCECEKESTAATLNCLGVLHFQLPEADTDTALHYLMTALSLQRPNTLAVATTLNNIGRVHFTASRLDLALEAYETALRVRRTLLGNDHPDVAATVYNAGQTVHQMGNLTLALSYYHEFARISSVLPRPNRYLVVVLKCLALIYHERDDDEKAFRLFHEALDAGRSILGVHADVASILNKLGNMYYERGEFDQAISVYEQGLAAERLVLEANHPNIAVTLSNIGQIYKQRGDFTTALKLYEEALAIQRTITDANNDATIALTMSNIGLIHYQSRRYEAALEMYQEALRIRREVFGEESLDAASCLNSIGLVLFKLGLQEMALESFSESLRIRRSIQGTCHRDIAIVLYNIATIQLDLGNDEEAIQCYKETLRVEKAALGPRHEDVMTTLEYLARVYQQRGEVYLAAEYYGEILSIQRQTGGHEKVARTLNMIANLRLQRGDTSGCMEALCEAVRILRQCGCLEDEIVVRGFDLYGISKLHPEAAGAA